MLRTGIAKGEEGMDGGGLHGLQVQVLEYHANVLSLQV